MSCYITLPDLLIDSSFVFNCTDHNSFSVFYLVQFFADWKAKTELKQAEKEKAEVILH